MVVVEIPHHYDSGIFLVVVVKLPYHYYFINLLWTYPPYGPNGPLWADFILNCKAHNFFSIGDIKTKLWENILHTKTHIFPSFGDILTLHLQDKYLTRSCQNYKNSKNAISGHLAWPQRAANVHKRLRTQPGTLFLGHWG